VLERRLVDNIKSAYASLSGVIFNFYHTEICLFHIYVCVCVCVYVCMYLFIYIFLGEEDSKTSAKEDLKSCEEIASTTPNTHQVPSSLEPLRTRNMLKKGRVQLVCHVC
jgi:hypothetical protein